MTDPNPPTPNTTTTPTTPTPAKPLTGMALALSEITSEIADEFDQCLSPASNHIISRALLDQCAFLDRTFRRFTKHIDEGNYTYIPTDSYEYAFKSIEQYRQTYGTLQSAAQEWKRLELLQQKIIADAKRGES